MANISRVSLCERIEKRFLGLETTCWLAGVVIAYILYYDIHTNINRLYIVVRCDKKLLTQILYPYAAGMGMMEHIETADVLYQLGKMIL
jgi:hypothetical protein